MCAEGLSQNNINHCQWFARDVCQGLIFLPIDNGLREGVCEGVREYEPDLLGIDMGQVWTVWDGVRLRLLSLMVEIWVRARK